jgi:hypothetical protein
VVENAAQCGVVFRVQVNGKDAGKQHGIRHLEPAHLHIPEQFADNDAAAQFRFAPLQVLARQPPDPFLFHLDVLPFRRLQSALL